MNETKTNVDSVAHRIFFDAILHPHRSLNPFGFKLLMATIAFMLLSIGIVFALLGAWPVIGFAVPNYCSCMSCSASIIAPGAPMNEFA